MVDRLFFLNMPGVPVDNRWTAFHPFTSWLVLLFGFNMVGFLAWAIAFAGHDEHPESASTAGLNETQLLRLENGKRMKKANDAISEPLLFLARGLCTLCTAKHLDEWTGSSQSSKYTHTSLDINGAQPRAIDFQGGAHNAKSLKCGPIWVWRSGEFWIDAAGVERVQRIDSTPHGPGAAGKA